MVKKIKVVELQTESKVEDQEQEQEQEMQQAPQPEEQEVEQPEPALQEQNSEIRESKAKTPFVEGSVPTPRKEGGKPRKPRAPKQTVKEPVEQVKEDKPKEEDSDSIDTEEMVAVIKNHRQSKKGGKRLLPPPPSTPAPTPPVEQVKEETNKQEEKTRCPDCNKLLTTKSLKYAHAKNCKANQPPGTSPSPHMGGEEQAQPVVFQEARAPPSIQDLLVAERVMRIGARKQRIQSLLSNAF